FVQLTKIRKLDNNDKKFFFISVTPIVIGWFVLCMFWQHNLFSAKKYSEKNSKNLENAISRF
ncbi:MAG: hypothetical protein IKR45_05655, partial [Treponema sp.]|nr:hypothetical protein [Treponema sp.]